MLRYEKVALCVRSELPICVGCCGHNYSSIDAIERDIKSNTVSLEEAGDDLISFRDRFGKGVRRSGICPCIVNVAGKSLCSIHPVVLGSEKDMRDGFCNIMYECKTAWKFKQWSEDVQKKFIEFCLEQCLDQIEYSLSIYNDLLLERFEREILKKT